MDGLECSEILMSELERTTRIDSEFYSKENLQISNRLKSYYTQPITENYYISDGNHMSVSDDFRDEGIPYYRGQDIYNTFIESASPICISENYYYQQNMERSHLQKNDILLSIVGAIIGNTSMVYSSRKATCSCKLAIIRPKDKAFKSFLVNVFLKSKYGQNQIQKFRRGTAQTGFLLEDMEQLLVPVFGETFSTQIQNVMNRLHKLITKSQEIYQSAESILLSSLNLDNFTPSTENTSIKSFSQVDQSGRMDAEYYQRKYDEIEEAIEKSKDNPAVIKISSLDRIVNIKKSIEPGSDEYVENGIPFIRVADVSKYELQPAKIFLNRRKFDIDALKPKHDTILLSKDGTVGIAYKTERDMDVITSGALLHLSVIDEQVDPDYLTLMLNSTLVSMQAERDVGGSILKHWRVDEIKKVRLPIIQTSIQQKISHKIRQSFALREQSKSLIKAATRAVEIAIEQDESTAIAYLREHTEGDA